LPPGRPGWTDKLLNFFSCLQKLEQRAKKCTELRGEYVEHIPSLAAVAFFLPGRAKDLSASPRFDTAEDFLHYRSEQYLNLCDCNVGSTQFDSDCRHSLSFIPGAGPDIQQVMRGVDDNVILDF